MDGIVWGAEVAKLTDFLGLVPRDGRRSGVSSSICISVSCRSASEWAAELVAAARRVK